MSGGHFNYLQYNFNQIADDIEHAVEINDSNELDQWGNTLGTHLPKDVIERFKETVVICRRSAKMVQRVDWLLSGDDGPESFLKRWKEEDLDG